MRTLAQGHWLADKTFRNPWNYFPHNQNRFKNIFWLLQSLFLKLLWCKKNIQPWKNSSLICGIKKCAWIKTKFLLILVQEVSSHNLAKMVIWPPAEVPNCLFGNCCRWRWCSASLQSALSAGPAPVAAQHHACWSAALLLDRLHLEGGWLTKGSRLNSQESLMK